MGIFCTFLELPWTIWQQISTVSPINWRISLIKWRTWIKNSGTRWPSSYRYQSTTFNANKQANKQTNTWSLILFCIMTSRLIFIFIRMRNPKSRTFRRIWKTLKACGANWPISSARMSKLSNWKRLSEPCKHSVNDSRKLLRYWIF